VNELFGSLILTMYNDISMSEFLTVCNREHAVNKDAIVVLNSGSVLQNHEELGADGPFNLFWPKPLPHLDKMRLNLCYELLS